MSRKRTIDQLGAGALHDYKEAGWRITEHGHLGTGQVTGPCALCNNPCTRYGPMGSPLCQDCRDMWEEQG